MYTDISSPLTELEVGVSISAILDNLRITPDIKVPFDGKVTIAYSICLDMYPLALEQLNFEHSTFDSNKLTQRLCVSEFEFRGIKIGKKHWFPSTYEKGDVLEGMYLGVDSDGVEVIAIAALLIEKEGVYGVESMSEDEKGLLEALREGGSEGGILCTINSFLGGVVSKAGIVSVDRENCISVRKVTDLDRSNVFRIIGGPVSP